MGSKEEKRENKIVKMFIIERDSERHVGVHYIILFIFLVFIILFYSVLCMLGKV